MNGRDNMFSLQDKTIIITGGAGLLGSTFSKVCAEYGASVVIVDVDEEKANELAEQIKKETRNNNSFLKDEVDFIMRYEFEDVSTYKLILEAIAHGKTKLGDIKDFIGVKRTDISPYLRNLIEVGMIKREIPITEKAKSRLGRYYISDNFLKFWFRFIYPNISAIEEGIFDIDLIKRDYNRYLGGIFEDVVKQFLIREKNKIFNFTRIGKWWHREREIDVVAMNESSKDILFMESQKKR